jgi:LPXTG-motif cell wall-anchored protein
MYTKLSFVDWPYVIGGLILFGVAFLIPRKKKKIKTE